MDSQPYATCPPPGSRIEELITGAYFHDAWAVTAGDAQLSALGQFLKALASTPRWIDACMSLRNRAMAKIGLKDLGALDNLDLSKPASTYVPGERVGIFTVFENGFDEALLGDRDKHLNVMLSVHRAAKEASGDVVVTVTTVVHVNNLLGRVYMLPVLPMHKLIAPTVLKAVAKPAEAPSKAAA